jgi:CheY-like chemotaxis protein
VVDDDPLVLVNTGVMLEDLGHTVIEVNCGHAALEILQTTNSIDLVITDQAMPEMTGLQLARTIRKTWRDLPIILATGFADLVAEPDLKLPILSKPYVQQDLVRVVADLFEGGLSGKGA